MKKQTIYCFNTHIILILHESNEFCSFRDLFDIVIGDRNRVSILKL